VATDLTGVAEAVRPSVVQVRPNGSGGAGVVLARHDGLVIVTNAHVARGNPGAKVPIVTSRGSVFEAIIEQVDALRDLAYLTPYPLSVNGEGDLLPAQVGDLSVIRPGHLVVAVGHPFGLANAFTAGVVHSVGPVRGEIPLPMGRRELSWIQADIRLAPGNSGGPLCDIAGRVLGINTMVVGGLALAVPISEVDSFLHASQFDSRAESASG
jgi:serine protease Do